MSRRTEYLYLTRASMAKIAFTFTRTSSRRSRHSKLCSIISLSKWPPMAALALASLV